MEKNCNKDSYTSECQQALAPILHTTDLSAHVKRFLGVSTILLFTAIVAVVAGWVYQLHVVANEKLPENVKINNGDLAQIQPMTSASSLAAIGIGQGAWATATLTIQPAATSTSPYASLSL